MRLAVCDPDAFYPLRSLITGPLTDLNELHDVELFIRTVVLHDEISMELEPFGDQGFEEEPFTEEERKEGGRLTITAFGPDLTGYDFISVTTGPGPKIPEYELAPDL